MIDRVLSFIFIITVITLIVTSYLEVPVIETMDNSSRQLGKLEERVKNESVTDS